MAGGTSASAFRSSRRRFTFSRHFIVVFSSNFFSKFKQDRLESLVSLQFVGNDKLNTAVIGLDLNGHLRLREVARLLIDHFIQ
jgi:hypothetical protein